MRLTLRLREGHSAKRAVGWQPVPLLGKLLYEPTLAPPVRLSPGSTVTGKDRGMARGASATEVYNSVFWYFGGRCEISTAEFSETQCAG